jgi:hypothetical protein
MLIDGTVKVFLIAYEHGGIHDAHAACMLPEGNRMIKQAGLLGAFIIVHIEDGAAGEIWLAPIASELKRLFFNFGKIVPLDARPARWLVQSSSP